MQKIFLAITLFFMWSSCAKENMNTDISALEQRAGECINITSFKLTEKRDAPGSYSIIADWSARPCDKTITLTMGLKVTNFRTKEVVLDIPGDLPLSYRFGYGGLAVGDWYQFNLYAKNALTNEVIEQKVLSKIVTSKI